MSSVADLYGVGRGPACGLERLPEPLARFASCCLFSYEQRAREISFDQINKKPALLPVPDGEDGQQAFAVTREALRELRVAGLWEPSLGRKAEGLRQDNMRGARKVSTGNAAEPARSSGAYPMTRRRSFQEKHVPAGFCPVNSPAMAQRQTKAKRLLTKRFSCALHGRCEAHKKAPRKRGRLAGGMTRHHASRSGGGVIAASACAQHVRAWLMIWSYASNRRIGAPSGSSWRVRVPAFDPIGSIWWPSR
jgi:hypothetical protein